MKHALKTAFDLRYQVLQPVQQSSAEADLRERVYKLWSSEWSRTFRELEVTSSLHSDDFVRREIGGLFLDQEPISLTLHDSFDISRPSHLDHSYFKDYPVEVMDEYRRLFRGPVMVASYMTLRWDWRRQHTDVPIAEVIFGLATKRFLESDAEALITYTRNNKQTNDIVYRHGGVPVMKNVTTYNVDVDYVYITRDTIKDSSAPGVAEAVNTLWVRAKRVSPLNRAA